MAQKGILEYDAKKIVAKVWEQYFGQDFKFTFQTALIDNENSLEEAVKANPWLQEKALVVKPDMLFGARGKNNLVLFKDQKPGDVRINQAQSWLNEKMNRETTLLSGATGILNRFIIEPFTPHNSDQEYYICASTDPAYDILYMSAAGGVEIMENWDKVQSVQIPLDADQDQLTQLIKAGIPQEIKEQETFLKFAVSFYRLFKDLHFAYLEFNPFILDGSNIHILDTVAKLDDTAGFLMKEIWGPIEYYSAFGQPEPSPEERMIQEMDEKSGSSLKLTILNPKGIVWTLVAGGGASVVFADSIAQVWGTEELANYGEYSGNPSKEETYHYTKTVIDLMTREKDKKNRNKILLIGGAIANFTDVAKTFDGIIQAFNDMANKMCETGIQIYVRRGGPNYQLGLRNIEEAAKKLGLPIEVYGPDTHLTEIVSTSYKSINN